MRRGGGHCRHFFPGDESFCVCVSLPLSLHLFPSLSVSLCVPLSSSSSLPLPLLLSYFQRRIKKNKWGEGTKAAWRLWKKGKKKSKMLLKGRPIRFHSQMSWIELNQRHNQSHSLTVLTRRFTPSAVQLFTTNRNLENTTQSRASNNHVPFHSNVPKEADADDNQTSVRN